MYDDKAYQRQRRQQRIEAGLCTRCGKRPAADGVLDCDECREWLRRRFQYEHANPELRAKRKASLQEWRKRNPERVRERERANAKRLRDAALDHYGRVCVCCGEDNPAFLTLDHIANDGNVHRASVSNVVRDLKRRGWPPVVQTMCWNCNQAKRIYGECPHQTRA